MESVAKLVSRTPPEGLTEWAPVRDDLKRWGLVYEVAWTPDRGLEQILDEWAPPRKIKMVEIRCSCCGEVRLMPWAKTDKRHGGYGFLQEDEETGETALVGSGDESVCPLCGTFVRVKKAAEIGCGYFVVDETNAMSASLVGRERYLALTGWTIQRRVYRNAHVRPAAMGQAPAAPESIGCLPPPPAYLKILFIKFFRLDNGINFRERSAQGIANTRKIW